MIHVTDIRAIERIGVPSLPQSVHARPAQMRSLCILHLGLGVESKEWHVRASLP